MCRKVEEKEKMMRKEGKRQEVECNRGQENKRKSRYNIIVTKRILANDIIVIK